MWVLTTSGFVSVVEQREGEHAGGLVARARERSALEALRRLAPTATEIEVSPHRDYRYRVFLSREAWAEALAEMGRTIGYDNFKAEVGRVQGRSRYERVLHEVWEVMGRTQPGGPYGWGGSGYPSVPAGERER